MLLGEITRADGAYGASPTDLYLFSLLVMIDRLDEYVGTTALDKKEFETRVESEAVLLNELLEFQGLDKTYRNQIGLKNAINEQFSTAIQCFDEHGLMDYLEKEE